VQDFLVAKRRGAEPHGPRKAVMEEEERTSPFAGMDVCCGLVYDHGRDRAMILPSHYRACKSKERLRAGRRDVGERWKHYSSLLGRRAEGSLRSVHKPVD
jgi:hypothetical protein